MTTEERWLALAERVVGVVETHLTETRKRHEESNAKTSAMIEASLPALVRLLSPGALGPDKPGGDVPPS